MVAGAVLAFFLVPPHQIVRKDGTRVAPVRHPSAASEIKGLYETLKSDYYILLLFPMFWASNWFYTYQQNCYNLYLFNLRGRAFNNIWYWLAQIIGAVLFGVILDNQRLGSRKMRAWIGWGILFVVVNVIVSHSPPSAFNLIDPYACGLIFVIFSGEEVSSFWIVIPTNVRISPTQPQTQLGPKPDSRLMDPSCFHPQLMFMVCNPDPASALLHPYLSILA